MVLLLFSHARGPAACIILSRVHVEEEMNRTSYSYEAL